MKIYSFPPISNPDATVLILGTMPGEQSLKLNQYYGHGGNAFWKLIFTIFKEPFSTDYETRKAFLLQNNIALWDVLEACEREGSADSEIRKEVPNDFESFFTNHPKIKLITFNGHNAERYFTKRVKIENNFTFITLPSTSPANARKTFEEKLSEWMIIKANKP
ncbi:MAG: DNA-deoxyinosine glycosylase [Flavobacterium sp.]